MNLGFICLVCLMYSIQYKETKLCVRVRNIHVCTQKMRNHLTLLEVCLKMGLAVQQMNLEMKDSKAI